MVRFCVCDVQVVIEAMKVFYSDPELPDYGSRAIMLLATKPANRDIFRRVGAKNVIERATNWRLQDPGLQQRSRQALLAVGDWAMGGEDFE